MQLSKKKVMLVNWPLLDVGGITTWSHQIIKGFNKLGWEAHHYYATRTGNLKCSETEFMPIGSKFRRGEKIPSKTIGFAGDSNVNYFKNLCLEYDYVLFVHPSPHPNKANLKAKNMEDWKRLYIECPVPRVVIFHDKKWRKTNEWFLDVVEDIEVVLAAQHNFIESVEDYSDSYVDKRKIITDWLFFPMDVDNAVANKGYLNNLRKNKLCMMPQWIKWKNHNKILEVADQIKTPIHFYNGGMEYHKLCKLKMWSDSIRVDWVEDEYVNKEALHEYHGFVTYEEVLKQYQECLGSIDLTTRTYQNYTHHESSLYGCILMCTEDCRVGPYNHIHDGEYHPIDSSDISGSINKFVELPEDIKMQIRIKAFERTVNDFDCKKVAAKINSIVESLNI